MDIRRFKRLYRQNVCKNCDLRNVCSRENARCERIIGCENCEIRDKCKSLCAMIEGFISKKPLVYEGIWGDRRNYDSTNESIIVKEKDIGKYSYTVCEDGVIYVRFIEPKQSNWKVNLTDIPWNCISETAARRIRQHFLEGMSYGEISTWEGKIKHEGRIYASVKKALKKLRRRYDDIKHFHKIKHKLPRQGRKYIEDYLVNNMKIRDIAKKYKKSEWTIRKRIQHFQKEVKK